MESRCGFIPALRFLSVLVPQSAQCCAVSAGRVQLQDCGGCIHEDKEEEQLRNLLYFLHN